MIIDNKQTAVDWLMPKILELTLQLSNKRISQRTCELKILNLFEQAKEMEQKQIENAFDDGEMNRDGNKYSSDYYNETFGDTK
jgi:hypothetical protein